MRWTYLTDDARRALKRYKYVGEDRSLVYKHVLSPLAAALVELVPRWVAPNLITVVGMAFVTASHVVVSLHHPALEGLAPGWVYVMAALCTLVYQTLDNMDGKQARRTGSSSPLGLLFDHGCDALNCTLGSVTLSAVLQTGATWKALATWLAGGVPFFLATWEELYTGALILPVVNGPTEGVIIIACAMLWTAFAGPEWWTAESFLVGVQNNTCFVLFSLVCALCAAAANLANVYMTPRRKEPYWRAVARLAPFAMLNALLVVWVVLTDIEATQPRLLTWLMGLLFSKMVMHIMIAHMCEQPFQPVSKTLIPVGVVASHCAFAVMRGGIITPFDQRLYLEELFLYSLVSYVHLVLTVVPDFCRTLDVHCFTIKRPKSP